MSEVTIAGLRKMSPRWLEKQVEESSYIAYDKAWHGVIYKCRSAMFVSPFPVLSDMGLTSGLIP